MYLPVSTPEYVDETGRSTIRVIKYNSTEFFVAVFPIRCPGLEETLNGVGVFMTACPMAKEDPYYCSILLKILMVLIQYAYNTNKQHIFQCVLLT
jgi:hypothetical protein